MLRVQTLSVHSLWALSLLPGCAPPASLQRRASELPKFGFLLSTGLSDASPDEGLIEDFAVEDKAVEQLVGGLLSHYLPDLQRSKQALQELT